MKRHIELLCGLLAMAMGTATWTDEAVAQKTLKVELDNTLRPVTHCASGSHYGLTETLPGNIGQDLAPLKPHVFCQPALAGKGHQQPLGSALECAQRIAQTGGQVMVTLADLLPNWPYKWPGKEQWLKQVREFIEAKLKSGATNIYGYLIWNERHGTWRPGGEAEWGDAINQSWYTDCWKPTYDLIRQLDPKARIIGPGDSYYRKDRMGEFLTFCKDNNCMPDNICWHELMGSNHIANDMKDYRALEKQLGIKELEIDINEYSDADHTKEGCPGYSVPIIAKFERYKVASACISYWFTQYPGRLGSLLTPDNKRGGGWWLYNWYGQMSGDMVNVVCPNDATKGIDGFANLDKSSNSASICLGGEDEGQVNVQITGMPAAFGGKVKVTVERVKWTDKDTEVAGTDKIEEEDYTVSNGSITVAVNNENKNYAYRISLRPAVFELKVELDIPAKVRVGESVALKATASASNGVSHIDFSASGNVFRHKYIYPYIHDTAFTTPGNFRIETVLFDNAGNTDTASAWITVQNAKDYAAEDFDLLVAPDTVLTKGVEAELRAVLPEEATADHIDFNVDGENLVHKYVKPYVWHFTPKEGKAYALEMVVYLPGQDPIKIEKKLTAAVPALSGLIGVAEDKLEVGQSEDALVVEKGEGIRQMQLYTTAGRLMRTAKGNSIATNGMHGPMLLLIDTEGGITAKMVIVR